MAVSRDLNRGLNIVIMIFCCHLTSGHSGLRQPPAIARNWKRAPVASPLECGWQRGKLFHALNANSLSGPVRSRTPCLGGVFADIGAVTALAMLNEPRRRGARRHLDQMTFFVSHDLSPLFLK